jgi:hypothetical protein
MRLEVIRHRRSADVGGDGPEGHQPHAQGPDLTKTTKDGDSKPPPPPKASSKKRNRNKKDLRVVTRDLLHLDDEHSRTPVSSILQPGTPGGDVGRWIASGDVAQLEELLLRGNAQLLLGDQLREQVFSRILGFIPCFLSN